jgi:microsomal epoxide hydrolase
MRPAEFTVAIEDRILDDLARRLRATNWPDDYDNEDEIYGIGRAFLQGLVKRWLDHYDWRAVERQINGFRHFRIAIDGVPIHYIREPGRGPKPLPLILTHGWPWTFWDLNKIIRPLADPASHGGDPADAFEVIVPSLPGFGLSTPLPPIPMNFCKTADLWQTLMTEPLGFPRYAAAGGDWGALVTEQLGHKYAASLYGIHVIHPIPLGLFNNERPWDVTEGLLPAGTPRDIRDAVTKAFVSRVSHVAVHMLDAQTLAYALHDSPTGLLAWLARRRRDWSDASHDWSDPAEQDHLITTALLYWTTNSFLTSARFYADADHHRWRASHDRQPAIEVPTGVTLLGGERLPGAGDQAEFVASGGSKAFNLHYLNSHAKGGHFGHYENPEACIADIRATFRDLR